MKSQERIKEALEKARYAFWESIVKSFPEAKYGDISPLAANEFDEVTEKVVGEWVTSNVVCKWE